LQNDVPEAYHAAVNTQQTNNSSWPRSDCIYVDVPQDDAQDGPPKILISATIVIMNLAQRTMVDHTVNAAVAALLMGKNKVTMARQ